MDDSAKLVEELNRLRLELVVCLKDSEHEYQALMREWFAGRLSKVQLEENVRVIIPPREICKHNLFTMKLIAFCREMSKKAVQNIHDTYHPSQVEQHIVSETGSKVVTEDSPQSKKRKLSQLKAAAADLQEKIQESTVTFESRESWKESVNNRIPSIIDKTDTKGPRVDHDSMTMKQTEGIVGRVYISLWEHGLHTVTHECVLVILKAAVDLMRRIIRQMIDLNFVRQMENPFLSALSNDSSLSKGPSQQSLSKDIRSTERELASSASSCVQDNMKTISVQSLRTILKLKPDLLPCSAFRNCVIEKCIATGSTNS